MFGWFSRRDPKPVSKTSLQLVNEMRNREYILAENHYKKIKYKNITLKCLWSAAETIVQWSKDKDLNYYVESTNNDYLLYEISRFNIQQIYFTIEKKSEIMNIDSAEEEIQGDIWEALTSLRNFFENKNPTLIYHSKEDREWDEDSVEVAVMVMATRLAANSGIASIMDMRDCSEPDPEKGQEFIAVVTNHRSTTVRKLVQSLRVLYANPDFRPG